MVAYEALGEFIPFYPVYAVLFADNGLSTGQISSLFVLWSVTGLVLEVPSGALADLVSRRALLVWAALFIGAGFATWMVSTGYWAFAAGFVLWGVGGALSSGAYEAYLYDVMTVDGTVDRYPTVIARGRASGLVLNLAATMLAAPLFEFDGFAAVGAVSVSACVLQAGVALALPRDRRPGNGNDVADGEVGYLDLLRLGLREARLSVPVRRAIVLAAVFPGFLAFDEYFGLLAEDLGASRTTLPLLIAVTVAAQAIGALLGGGCRPRLVAPAIAGGAALLAGGVLTGVPTGFLAVAAGYGLLQMSIVVAETRLQAAITGPARATVTSVCGVLSEFATIGLYLGVALGSTWFALPALMVGLAAVLSPTAILAHRWLR